MEKVVILDVYSSAPFLVKYKEIDIYASRRLSNDPLHEKISNSSFEILLNVQVQLSFRFCKLL